MGSREDAGRDTWPSEFVVLRWSAGYDARRGRGEPRG